ncbi:MAG: GNAT family N-acetyltransferase [Terriglobia bacterium]
MTANHPRSSRVEVDNVQFNPQPGEAYGPLTFPRYRPFLAADREDISAFGFELDQQPIALAVVFWRSSTKFPPRLLSIAVARPYRGQRVASDLLRRVELATAERGFQSITTIYSVKLPDRAGLERLLAAREWSAPRIAEFRTAGYALDVAAEMARIEPARHPYLPDGAEIAPWFSATEEERGQIEALVQTPGYKLLFAPFVFEKTAHPELSKILRYRGRAVGWVMGEMNNPELCYYSNAFVLPELQRRGALIALIRDVCRCQAKLLGPRSVAQLSTTPAIPGMPRFMRERLAPAALWYDEQMECTKNLAPHEIDGGS